MPNNPFSVPQSPPALIDPPKSRTKKLLLWIALVLTVTVWYGIPSQTWLTSFTFHALIIASLFNDGDSQFLLDSYAPLHWGIEIAFLGIVSFAIWRRSLRFMLCVLAFAICWSVANYAYVMTLITK